ncbi:inhibitor of nuclear factor kappa-B kinase-interacting protein-like isoform X2 [Carcharodon carcharias]|uniref:inhibitor of nuclear factor kappa-B kinase-interacting protein-like isoform X2 n=1 Tax=Carcharodon carcharias TaxID=13397 RepID=UPI001B7E08F3|nr:inhibitor of nuclear factor kappa-B kinase-interacting protein-like isoform X2 [Carcharodon carcharias]
MSSEARQRKKNVAASKQSDGVREQAVKGKVSEDQEPEGGRCCRPLGVRNALCLLSLLASAALAGLMYQQSAKFAEVEQKYQQLYMRSVAAQALEDELSKVSKKLDSSEEVLQKALSSSSVMTLFEQEMSELRSSMTSLQNKEQTIARKMQNVNKNFQNISDTWKQSLNEINSEIANLKSESKNMHNKISSEINTVEQGVKDLTEKMEDLEVSTIRNTKAIKRQEEEDLGGLEKQANWNTRTIERLVEQQINLISKDRELVEKLTEYEPKLKECQEHLPSIDDGVHSILKVSSDLLNTEKKMDDMTVQIFNLEDNMLKVVTEILDIKKELELLLSDNTI